MSAALLLPLAFLTPILRHRWFHSIDAAVNHIAGRRPWAVLLILFLGLTLRVTLIPIEPVPAPGIQDEFGYLLAADTFAQGRLTNPTHPLWVHFESMGIIQQPTYCSVFWPAQGVFLATGQVLFGHPFWGVWLSFGLMCAAFSWALQGWMPPRWAFLGGVLAVLRLGVFTYWANSYWGGAVAALGGALVFGALSRLRRSCKVQDSLLMGLGLVLLANSRPYEGLCYSLPFIAALVIICKKSQSRAESVFNIVLPLSAVMAIMLALMGYYFWRTTGNAWRPPYVVDLATYIQEPQFLFQSLSPPKQYHHAVLQHFYGDYHVQLFLRAKHSPIIFSIGKIAYVWIFFVGLAFTLPCCFLLGILPSGLSLRDFGHKTLFCWCVLGVSLASLLPLDYMNPHYAAPMACVVYALVLQALRRVWVWDRCGRRRGIALVRATVGMCFLTFAACTFALAHRVPHQRLFPYDPIGPNLQRASLINELKDKGGRHLIIVRYSPEHSGHEEWVYNDADIDRSTVVWAREMDSAENQRLLNYFKDREVWLLEADSRPLQLKKYSGLRSENAAGMLNSTAQK